MERFSGLLILLIFCVLALAGCGGDVTATPVPPTPTSTIAGTATPVTNLTARAATINPTAVSTTMIAATTVTPTMASIPPTIPAPKSSPPTTTATTVASAGVGLPIYSGLKPINLGGFEQQLALGLTGQAGTNARYKAYSTSDTSGKVFGFYDSEMVKANFSKGPETEIPSQPGINLKGKIATYTSQKGPGQNTSGAAIIFLGPLDDTLIALFTVGAPDAAKQLKAGDSLVILFNDLSGPALQGSSSSSPVASSPKPGTFVSPGPTK